MAKGKKQEEKQVNTQGTNQAKFKTEVLLKSKKFSGYHKAFVQTILGDKEYTVPEALEKIDAYMKAPIKH